MPREPAAPNTTLKMPNRTTFLAVRCQGQTNPPTHTHMPACKGQTLEWLEVNLEIKST